MEILRGAAAKSQEAGIAIVGGHTIQTDEPIFGLAVVGRARPGLVITNAGARPGDFLVLTKPLGLGIITTAAKRNEDDQKAISEAISVMTTLNRDTSIIMIEAGTRALTDVTGFGLLGHLRGMAAASGVSAGVGPTWFQSCLPPGFMFKRGLCLAAAMRTFASFRAGSTTTKI